MRIEKVNDTQIRCTLTKEDLAERQIKLSELAYGSEKAKNLFRDMMQQAAFEFGFEADNIPLMVEAIPLSTESIILIITKVEYPEELDTRFSQFSPASEEDDPEEGLSQVEQPLLEGAEDIMNLLNRLKERATKPEDSKTDTSIDRSTDAKDKVIQETKQPVNLTKLFVFHQLQDVEQVADVLKGVCFGENELYRNAKDGKYYLFLHRSGYSSEAFSRVCNILSEYAKQIHYTNATEAFFKEHFQPVIEKFALQTLSDL